MRVAPNLAPARIGVLLPTAPSMRWSSPMRTDGKAPGIAALAIIASTAGPEERQTAVPPRFVAMTCTGIIASSRFAKGRWRSSNLLRLDGSIRWSGRPSSPTTLRSVKGNTSCRRSARQIVSSFSIPGPACKIARVNRSHRRADDEVGADRSASAHATCRPEPLPNCLRQQTQTPFFRWPGARFAAPSGPIIVRRHSGFQCHNCSSSLRATALSRYSDIRSEPPTVLSFSFEEPFWLSTIGISPSRHYPGSVAAISLL